MVKMNENNHELSILVHCKNKCELTPKGWQLSCHPFGVNLHLLSNLNKLRSRFLQ